MKAIRIGAEVMVKGPAWAVVLLAQGLHGTLRGSGIAVFVGKECCVQVANVLKALSFLPAPPPYTADRNHDNAVLRYKLSYVLIRS